jgi:hypothetical protein
MNLRAHLVALKGGAILQIPRTIITLQVETPAIAAQAIRIFV